MNNPLRFIDPTGLDPWAFDAGGTSDSFKLGDGALVLDANEFTDAAADLSWQNQANASNPFSWAFYGAQGLLYELADLMLPDNFDELAIDLMAGQLLSQVGPLIEGASHQIGAKFGKVASKLSKLFNKTDDATGVGTKTLQTYYPPNNGFSAGQGTSTTLKSGAFFDRYGYPGGKYGSPVGTPSGARALSPGTLSKPYTVYEVVKDVEVLSGQASSWFGQMGGGTQYYFSQSIQKLLKSGVIKVVP